MNVYDKMSDETIKRASLCPEKTGVFHFSFHQYDRYIKKREMSNYLLLFFSPAITSHTNSMRTLLEHKS